ncbi:MAG: hypothetical protein WCY29_04895 [Novosphingobium sp.]
MGRTGYRNGNVTNPFPAQRIPPARDARNPRVPAPGDRASQQIGRGRFLSLDTVNSVNFVNRNPETGDRVMIRRGGIIPTRLAD